MILLSDHLKQWRADRPDEWKMDEFIKEAEHLESLNKENAINIILDESKTTPNVYFVEIENDHGESISVGKRTVVDGYAQIRITSSDIEENGSIRGVI